MKKESNLIGKLFIFIFAIGAILRISLGVINDQANDNHLKVSSIIETENRIPQKKECEQCYHPKLFHFSIAALSKLIPSDSADSREKLAQIINVLAGIATMWLVWLFLKRVNSSDYSKLIAFAFVSLNPALITINAQATNDSFVILFSTLALYSFYLFIHSKNYRDLILMIMGTGLAILSKGSGVVIFFGIFIILLFFLFSEWKNPERNRRLGEILFFLLCILILVFFFSPYPDYYQKYGNPFVINKPRDPFPRWREKTYVGEKTAVISIADSYFNFRIVDLIKNPTLNRAEKIKNYTASRSSLWTQLYARTNFSQYDTSLSKWTLDRKSKLHALAKLIFILALLPLTLFILGLFRNINSALVSFFKNGLASLNKNKDWVFLFFTLLFLAFMVKMTLDYREFTTMKPIYIYPALLAFTKIFVDGISLVEKKIKSFWLTKAFNLIILLLFISQTISIIALIIQIKNFDA